MQSYDDWKCSSPDEDEPREMLEPDWDAIREEREARDRAAREVRLCCDSCGGRMDPEAPHAIGDGGPICLGCADREMARHDVGVTLAGPIDSGDMDQEF
jgi:hypothetical protein